MNVVFVTLLYSGGVPILLPIAMMSILITFGIDKVCISSNNNSNSRPCAACCVLAPSRMRPLATRHHRQILLLRYYHKPPSYDSSLSRLMTSLLPWGLLAHIAVSAWMFGNNDVSKQGLCARRR